MMFVSKGDMVLTAGALKALFLLKARAVHFIFAYHYAAFDDLFCSLFAGYDRRRMRFRVFG